MEIDEQDRPTNQPSAAALLVTRLEEALACQQTGDPAPILAAELLDTADQLVVDTALDYNGTVPVEVAYAVALLRTGRYMAGGAAEDRAIAAGILADLAASGYDEITAQLAPLLKADTTAATADDVTRLITEAQAGGDIDTAVAAAELLVSDTPAGHPEHSARLSHLGLALRLRFDRQAHEVDLDHAIDAGLRAVAASTDDDLERAGYFSNLADSLQTRYEHAGRRDDLKASLGYHRVAAATAAHHPSAALIWSGLGSALLAWAPADVPELLDEAVEACRNAVRLAADTPAATSCRSGLAIALASRSSRTGSGADLDEAILEARAAVAATADDHPMLPGRQTNLAAALHLRYLRHDTAKDLDDAVAAAHSAVTHHQRDLAYTGLYLANLAYILRVRAERGADAADIDAAATAAAAAVETTPPGHSSNAARHAMLAAALLTRYEHNAQPHDLLAALSAIEQVLPELEETDADRPLVLTNLCVLLRHRAELTDTTEDIDSAVVAGEQAVVALTPGHPDRAGAQLNLGTALACRHAATSEPSDLAAAIAAWRLAANQPTAPVDIRMAAARTWATAATNARRFESAAEAAMTTIELLTLLAWRGGARSDQERRLSENAGVGRDAAASLTAIDAADCAVLALESGRTVLWTQLLEFGDDLALLHGKVPRLAAELLRVRDALATPLRPLGTG